MEGLNTAPEIIKHLDALIGKSFTYCKKVQSIRKYELYEEREVVLVHFTLSDSKRLTFEDMPSFLNRVWRDIETANTEVATTTPTHIKPTGRVKEDIEAALSLSNHSFDACINSLLSELEGDLTDPKVKERILLKTKVTDAIIKVEVAKTSRGSVMAKLIKP